MTAPAHGTDRKLSKEEIDELRDRVKTFMDSDVYPNEGFFHEHSPRRDPQGIAKMKQLQAKTKAMGMWAPHLPAAAGGMGIGFMPYVYMNEILGRSSVAPMAFGSQAPDSGNAEILWQFGSLIPASFLYGLTLSMYGLAYCSLFQKLTFSELRCS